MDRMTSSTFRKCYPRLDRPVVVTVLGLELGTWTPARSGRTVSDPETGVVAAPAELHVVKVRVERPVHEPAPSASGTAARSFRPAGR